MDPWKSNSVLNILTMMKSFSYLIELLPSIMLKNKMEITSDIRKEFLQRNKHVQERGFYAFCE